MIYNLDIYRKDNSNKTYSSQTIAKNINNAINILILSKDFDITKLKSFWQKDQLLAIINCDINGVNSHIVVHCYS